MRKRTAKPGTPRPANGLDALPEATHDVLLNICQALGESKDLRQLIAIVRRELARLIDTRNFYLALYDETRGTYSFPYYADEFDDLQNLGPEQLARSLTDYVRRSGRGLLVDEDLHDKLIREGEVELVGTPSPIWLGVPLQGTGRVLGVMAVQSYSRRTLYSQGDLLLLSSISRHIGLTIERKQVEDALSESEQRFRSFLAAVTDGIVFHDGSKILDANDAMTRMCGYEWAELVGGDLLRLVAPQHRARAAESIRRGGEQQFELLGQRKDGSTVPLAIHPRDISYRGSASRVAIVRDISERQDATRALKESEERYRGLFESSQEAIFVSGVDGKLVDVNPAAVELFGFSSREELLSADLAKELYVNPPERANLLGLLEKQGRIRDYELRLKTKQGKELIVLETSEVLKNAAGDVVGYRGLLRDVTKARELERQFLQAQKMEAVGRLAGGIAHDFNNLLVVINGYAELLAGKLAPGDPWRKDLETIRDAGLRAADLVGQLLAFSRQQVLRPRVLDLNEVVEKFTELISRAVGDDIAVKLSLAPSLCRVKADVGQLEQVLMNLAVNARDAMPEGGELIIETWNAEFEEGQTIRQVPVRSGRYSVVAVRDTGGGIDDADVDRLFEPFFTTKRTGTGLGLSTVYGIVKQSGGYIWADSERGKGTTFTVYLPRVDQEPEAKEEDVVTTFPIDGTKTILVVDDDPGVCSFAHEALEGFGYLVLTATDAEGALGICRAQAQPIDLLLTDTVMPGMNGAGLAKLAKRLRPEMEVVFMTGYIDGLHAHEGSIEDGLTVLRKPFSAKQLADRVYSAVQQGRPEIYDK